MQERKRYRSQYLPFSLLRSRISKKGFALGDEYNKKNYLLLLK